MTIEGPASLAPAHALQEAARLWQHRAQQVLDHAHLVLRVRPLVAHEAVEATQGVRRQQRDKLVARREAQLELGRSHGATDGEAQDADEDQEGGGVGDLRRLRGGASRLKSLVRNSVKDATSYVSFHLCPGCIT